MHHALARAVAVAVVAAAALPSVAFADGTVSFRGAYYKERATRVSQPMVDADLEAGEDGRVAAHFLVDAITSASTAAGAEGIPFTELRYEGGGSYLKSFGDFRLGGGGRLSWEPDYLSGFVNLRGEIDLAQRNTTLGLALAQGRDRITNAGAQGGMAPEIDGDLSSTLASASLSQILSPDLVASMTYDFVYLSGFQENVYRVVAAGGAFEPERVPDVRVRHAVAAAVRGYVSPTNSVVILGYRFYADDWGIIGHTAEVRVAQPIRDGIDVHLRYRLYQQGEADFYREIYDTADPMIEPFLTADEKLSGMRTQTITAKLDLRLGLLGIAGRMENAWGHLLVEHIRQTTSFGNAVAAQLAITVPVSY
jgi:hypothetical protein